VWGGGGAGFVRTGVRRMGGARLIRHGGAFDARVIIDCSGWRGVLVNGGETVNPSRRAYTFGLEAYTPVRDDRLTFFIDRTIIPRGMGWIFPVGTGSLIGVGSYVGVSKLRGRLDRYLRHQGTVPDHYHGTYFPNRCGRPTAGRVFAVGDAAGQCLPLTAEGIRPALYFGGECGKLVQRVLDGAMTLDAALDGYRALVERYRSAYRVLEYVQWATTHLPLAVLGAFTRIAARQPLLSRWWPRYGGFGRFGPLAAST